MELRSSYTEAAPPAALSDAVACVWTRTIGPESEGPVRVVPDACVDLIWSNATGAFLAGPDTGPHLVPAESGTVLVGARLRPGAGGPALGLPLAPLLDGRPDLAALGLRLDERLDPDLDPALALRRLAAATFRIAGARGPDPAVATAVHALRRSGARTGRLARELGLGERQLRRRFEAAVGYGPKALQRILRFQRFLDRIDAAAEPADLAEAAHECGYADQSHLTRECRELSGLTPAALRDERRPDAVASPPAPA